MGSGGPEPIYLAVVLGTGERHGPAATRWTIDLLGRHLYDHGVPIRNFTCPKTFDLPGQSRRRRLYRLDFSDQHAPTWDQQRPVRTYFGMDSRVATTARACLAWIPDVRALPSNLPHLPGRDQWLVLAQSDESPTRWARARSQSRATAVIAALAVDRIVAGLSPAVHHSHNVLTLNDVPASRGITVGADIPARRS